VAGPTNPHAATDCDLDEWTRRVLDVHFDPEGGTPYWLDWADDRGVDVRSRVETFADLKRVFEPFDDTVLREIDVSRFAPRSLSGPRRVYETGGTTGAPKRVVMVDYWHQQAAWASRVLATDDFPRGNLLMLGPPGGANNAGVFVRHLADEWGTLAYFVNMDPRWAKRLSERRDPDEFEAYVEHLLDQAERVLATQDVTVLFTTARLLERPRVRDLVAEHGVRAVYHGGTALDPGTYRHFRESWYADVAFAGEYGNTLMGVAQEVPTAMRPPGERDYRPQYVPCHPYFLPEVLDGDGDPVDYGERGRVRLTVLTGELFIPLLDERDEATRVAGEAPYPWDWVGTPGSGTDTEEAVEGVY
jgi:thienamycin biosynthesis protein ThnN